MTDDRAEDDRFRMISDQAPVGIFETDLDGGCVWVQALDGDHRDGGRDALGEGWAAALHPDDRAGVFVAWGEAAASSTEFNLEYRFRASDGRVAWVAGRAREMRGQDGRVSGYLGTVADITGASRRKRRCVRARRGTARSRGICRVGR